MITYSFNAIVNHVHDGDTVNVDIDLGFDIWIRNKNLRLFGIDTPELNTFAGQEALKYIGSLLKPKTPVALFTTKKFYDKYGRVLATIVLNGKNVNQAMVDAGHAVPYFGGHKDGVQPKLPASGPAQ